MRKSPTKFDFKTHSQAALIGYYAAIAAVGLITGSLGPTLSGLAANAHTSLQGISVILIAGPLGYMLGSLLTGFLLDRLPGHPVFVGAAILGSATLFFTPLMTSVWGVALVIGLMGLAAAGMDVGGNTLLGWVFGDKVGPYMNALHFFFGIGSMTASLVTAQALGLTGGITWAYWVLAMLLLPVAVWMTRIPSPPHIHSKGKPKARATNRLLLSLFILFFIFYCGLEMGYGNWICNYAKALRFEDEVHAAYLTLVFWGALTAGRLLGIPIAARVKPATILAFDIAGCAASIGVVLLWPDIPWVLWAATVGAGFSMASIFPTLMTFAGQSLSLTGFISSLFFVGVTVGSSVFPWLIGQGFESIGPVLLMRISLLNIGLMFLVLAVLALKTPKVSKR